MEYNKTVSNPMLIGAIELMKADASPEHRRMLSDEIVKAQFLIPAMVSPAPEADKDGQMHPATGSQIQFPILTAPDKKQFFMAFTDMEELKKWKDVEGQQFFAMTFEDYAGLLLKKDEQGRSNPAAGFVINPFGGNIIVSKEMVAQYISVKAQQAQAQREKAQKENGPEK